MAITAEHMSKFAALHRQRWLLQMSEKLSSGTKNSKQKKKTTNKQINLRLPFHFQQRVQVI